MSRLRWIGLGLGGLLLAWALAFGTVIPSHADGDAEPCLPDSCMHLLPTPSPSRF